MRKLITKKALAGFTLIELVIVIVILGVLIAAAIPKYKDLQFESKQSSTFGSLSSLRSATSIWIAKESSHSPPIFGLDDEVCTICNGGDGPDDTTVNVDFFPSYVQKVPKNEIFESYTGITTNEAGVSFYTASGLLTSTGAWLGQDSNCDAGVARSSTGKVDEASGWMYAAEEVSGTGGGEGFDWRINLNDCLPGNAASTGNGYFAK